MARAEMELEIGGVTRRFRMGMNEVAELEKRLEYRSVFKLMEQGELGILVVREALFCGLRPYNHAVTANQVGGWMTDEPHRFPYFVNQVAQSLAICFGQDRPATEKEAEAANVPLEVSSTVAKPTSSSPTPAF